MTNPRLIDVIKRAVAQAKLDAHPVGSLYWSREATDPAELFGGVWRRVKDKFILAAGDSYAAGSTGGEAEHTLTLAESPAHTHTRGTMEIVGGGVSAFAWGTKTKNYDNPSGAFSLSQPGNGEVTTPDAWNDTTPEGRRPWGLNFMASSGWTGATSSVGGGAAHNNMPPFAAYYCWERTE